MNEMIYRAFAEIFKLMVEADTDNVELTFDFNGVKAKFDVILTDAKKTDIGEENNGRKDRN